jgi:hypothetical protein
LLQVCTQLRPLHVTEPLAGDVQGAQVLPQELVLVLPLTTQLLPQAWKPVSHFTPQARGLPLQVAVPLLAGLVHALHELPQLAGLSLATQAFPQR